MLQKEIIRKVRSIFQKTLLNYEEEKVWGIIALVGGKFYIAAIKNRVHIGFAINGLNKEEIGFFRELAKQ